VIEVAGGSRDYFQQVVFIASGVMHFEDALHFQDLLEEISPARWPVEDDSDEGGEGIAGCLRATPRSSMRCTRSAAAGGEQPIIAASSAQVARAFLTSALATFESIPESTSIFRIVSHSGAFR
jgi:hypothetical protein